MTQHYFANGKLLLTGEYVILDGALAIGMPCKLGQHLTVEKSDNPNIISWEAKLHDSSHWFSVKFDTSDFAILETDELETANQLRNIFREIALLNPNLLSKGYNFISKLDFPRSWGLGSSSTLLALLAKFANVDAFQLSDKTFGGSGYDVSCAMLPKVQTYQLNKKDRKVGFVQLHPEITQYIYFVHLNHKQNSREGIDLYRAIPKSKRLVKSISDISKEIISCDNIDDFEDLLYVHEQLLSDHLGIPTVQEKLFPEYKEGIMKSLGAWGGDFILVTNRTQDLSFFNRKGYTTQFMYNELVVE